MKIIKIRSIIFCALMVLNLKSPGINAQSHSFSNFSQDSRLEDLSKPTRCFFEAVAEYNETKLGNCLDQNISVNIVGMRFQGIDETVGFAKRDIWGGKYKVEKVFKKGREEVVHCLFWPRGWSSPEPAIEYRFRFKNNKISYWFGKYR